MSNKHTYIMTPEVATHFYQLILEKAHAQMDSNQAREELLEELKQVIPGDSGEANMIRGVTLARLTTEVVEMVMIAKITPEKQ